MVRVHSRSEHSEQHTCVRRLDGVRHACGRVKHVPRLGRLGTVSEPENRGTVENDHHFVVLVVNVQPSGPGAAELNDHEAHVVGVATGQTRRRSVRARSAREGASVRDRGRYRLCRGRMLTRRLLVGQRCASWPLGAAPCRGGSYAIHRHLTRLARAREEDTVIGKAELEIKYCVT
jgi:hypothetical protein